jgi:hypothetical protein
MDGITWAVVASVAGVLSSTIVLIWSAITVRNQEKKHIEEEGRRSRDHQVRVKSPEGESVSFDVSSATPEQLVSFIARVKEWSDAAEKFELCGHLLAGVVPRCPSVPAGSAVSRPSRFAVIRGRCASLDTAATT